MRKQSVARSGNMNGIRRADIGRTPSDHPSPAISHVVSGKSSPAVDTRIRTPVGAEEGE